MESSHVLGQFCCCSVFKSYLTLCNIMDCSTLGFPVLHYFPEFAENSCPLNQWCHPTISPSVTLFSYCPRSFPALGSFPMSWLPASGGQSTGASASVSISFSISPSSEYSGLISFRMDWFELCAVQGILKSSPAPQFEGINSLALSFLYCPVLPSIQDYWKKT